jgi:mono/diheme cytochrome c family protein
MAHKPLLFVLLGLAACGAKPATPAAPQPTAISVSEMPTPVAAAAPIGDPNARLLADEVSAWEVAKPAFAKYCASCHTQDGAKASATKLGHFTMDAYPLGGHHASTIGATMRDVLGLSGKKATMPADKPGSVTGADLAVIEAWINAWDAAEQGGAHPPAQHHHHH